MSSFDIVIPTFNSELTIEQTLASIAHQIVLPKTVHIVDDCSTDETIARVSKFKSELNLRVTEFKINKGTWAARNAGVEASNADLIAFVDSDDLLLPEHISTHYELFEQGNDAVATNYFDWIPELNRTRLDPRKFPMKHDYEKQILKRNFIAGFSSIKRDVFVELGGFRPEVTEDWDLWIRFFRGNYSISKTDKPTYLYRWRSGSISRAPEALSRDLNTLRIARLETGSRNLKNTIDFNAVSMIAHAFVSRDRFYQEQEAKIVSAFPWVIRFFHVLLKQIDYALPISFKKMIVSKQKKFRMYGFEKSTLGVKNR